MAYTYVIWAEYTDRFKIGTTRRDPVTRAKEIDAGCPFHVRIVGLFADERERDLHMRYAQYRVKGEWFALPESAVWELLDTPENLAIN